MTGIHQTGEKKLAYAVMNAGPPPCEENGGCKNYGRCASERLACRNFARYVTGEVRPIKSIRAGIPNRETYELAVEGKKKPHKTKKLRRPENQVCSVCGIEKNRKRDFPRSASRCFQCRPTTGEKKAAARRRYYARQMAILMGEVG